jgi:hypothetical protein
VEEHHLHIPFKGRSTEYNWGAGTTFTTSVSNANADTYTFVITDANGCTTTIANVSFPITDPTVTATQVNVSCNAGSDGSVTLTGAGGSGGYLYSNNATGFTTNATFTGLAGTYTFMYVTKLSRFSISYDYGTFYYYHQLRRQHYVIIALPTPINRLLLLYLQVERERIRIVMIMADLTDQVAFTVNDNGTTQTFQIIVKDANGCLSPVQTITLQP